MTGEEQIMGISKQEAASLAQFCADQYYEFNANTWLQRSTQDRNASAVAAKYLALTSWYGHEVQLERIAAVSMASCGHTQSDGLDLAAFSASVRYAIALKRIGSGLGESKQ
jgi:hypothetical protein